MFERFTRSARAVVDRAESKAVGTTSSEIRPEHLLAALLDEEGCLALRVLEGLGVSPERLVSLLADTRRHLVDGLDEEDAEALRLIGIDLDEVVRRIDRNLGGLAARRPGRVRFSRTSKKVLELALREALALRHNYIGTEHLLLGLARSGDPVVGDVLDGAGLGQRALRAAVADAVRRAG